MANEPKAKSGAKKKASEKKAPTPRAPKTPEQKQSYTAGVTCGRGKHHWVDKGSYFKCEGGANPLCRSTKTKHAAKKAKAPKGKGGKKAPAKGAAAGHASGPTPPAAHEPKAPAAAAPAPAAPTPGATQAPSFTRASLPDEHGLFLKAPDTGGEEAYARYMRPYAPEGRPGLRWAQAAPRTQGQGGAQPERGIGAVLSPAGRKRPGTG